MTYKSDVEIDLSLNKIINEINSENNLKYKRDNNIEEKNHYLTNTNIMDILYKNNAQSLMLMEAEKMFMAKDYTNTYKKLKKK